jgi:hypothetical protein
MELVNKAIPAPTRDFVDYGRQLPSVVWPNRAKVVVNLVVNYLRGKP